MKYLSTFLFLITLLFSGCESNQPKPNFPVGEGVEIYLTQQVNSFKWDTDYSQINLDTIQLQALPFISYNQMKAYNDNTYTATLTVALSQLSGYQPNIYGHMFVLTVDGKRMYCGFVQPLISSAYLQWIVINEPLEVEGKNRNLKINFNLPAPDKDPRNKSEIIERFQKDGKLAR